MALSFTVCLQYLPQNTPYGPLSVLRGLFFAVVVVDDVVVLFVFRRDSDLLMMGGYLPKKLVEETNSKQNLQIVLSI